MAQNVAYITSLTGTNVPNPLILGVGGNGEFLRKIEVSAWNKIRIGLRITAKEFNSNSASATVGSNLLGTPRFYIGMCNYNRGGVASKNSAMHFVGIRSNAATFARSTGGGGGPVTYYTPGVNTVKREVNTFTAGTLVTCLLPIITSFPPTLFSMYSIDINKTNPAQTVISTFCPSNAATGFTNITPDVFLSNMESATPSGTGYTYTNIAPISIDENANGLLNAVNVYWSRSRASLYIAEIWYSILA
jgi:hypothetical protein